MAALRYTLLLVVLLIAALLLAANWYDYSGPYTIEAGSSERLDAASVHKMVADGWQPFEIRQFADGAGEMLYLRRPRLHVF